MNTLKLSLNNFQSISNGELEFNTGLNFIIGQSNSGKTGTFRALDACLSNPIGTQEYIKWEHNRAQVTLEYNGNNISWIRTPKESSYVINGEEYAKTGKSNAFKIIDDTGFTTDFDDNIMNIEEELDLPFPFGLSSAELFKLYEDVFCISDSSVILKSAKDHENGVKSEITLIENEVNKNENKLKELQKFKEEINLDKLKEYKYFLENKYSRIDLLKDGLDVIKKAVKASEVDLKVNSIDFTNKLNNYNELISLKNIISKLKNLHLIEKELKNVTYSETSKLEKYNELVNLKNTLQKLKELNKIKFSTLEVEDKSNKLKELVKYKKEIEHIFTQVEAQGEVLDTAKRNMVKLEEKLKEFKVCPLCGSPLEEENEQDNRRRI